MVYCGTGDYRRVRKEDMRRIAKATGASIVTTLADMEGNESFDPEVLGEAEEVRIWLRAKIAPFCYSSTTVPCMLYLILTSPLFWSSGANYMCGAICHRLYRFVSSVLATGS